MTGPEELLIEALHERVDHRDLPATPMRDVVTTARRLQRHRRIRTGVVAAAVVAVLATPFVIDAAHRSGTGPRPADRPSTYWSPTDADPRVLLSNVALGDPPAVPWFDGSDYVAADGTRTTLPVDQIGSATPYRGGFLVSAYGDYHLTLLDSHLQEVWRRCASPGLAVSQDGLRTAYPTGNCGLSAGTLHHGPTDGSDEQIARFPSGGQVPVGFLGDAVVVSAYGGVPPALVDADGTTTTIDRLRYVGGVDDRHGLVSGQLASGGDLRPTAAVVDPRTGVVKWRAPHWSLKAFSPDGSMVVGARTDEGGSGVAIFDAETGKQLHGFALPRHFAFTQVAWEDDEHLVMATTQLHTQALLRTTLDGAIQRASDVAPYDADEGAGVRFGLAPDLLP
jgi:hypothetical protein